MLSLGIRETGLPVSAPHSYLGPRLRQVSAGSGWKYVWSECFPFFDVDISGHAQYSQLAVTSHVDKTAEYNPKKLICSIKAGFFFLNQHTLIQLKSYVQVYL